MNASKIEHKNAEPWVMPQPFLAADAASSGFSWVHSTLLQISALHIQPWVGVHQ